MLDITNKYLKKTPKSKTSLQVNKKIPLGQRRNTKQTAKFLQNNANK